MGSGGSLSSDNRSISPTHSDDSRSVTPPVVQKQSTSNEKPKPPLRKRRPAPKPPQKNVVENTSKPSSQISDVSTNVKSKLLIENNGLTICHSRNSSDSSGYHEPSTLSDHFNTTLPRKPRMNSTENCNADEKLLGEHSKSVGNLTKMALHSKSTSSLQMGKSKKNCCDLFVFLTKRF